MTQLVPLIRDLALILVCAGITTLVFKRLRQPLVLGYIVAGFFAGPHISWTPSVLDVKSLHTWSEIGVIFLLFALGLEFSFKKMLKSGSTPLMAACFIILSMIGVGVTVGWGFGWKPMDCLYLGGMLAMSSTTIIYKAFDDMGLRQQRFAGLVLSILIVEDILAIVLMVLLSTIAASQHFEGSELVLSILKLLFFLVLWFVVGMYLVPSFLKRSRKWVGNETLLILSLGMCFGMVVVAAEVGFSPAFGAFIMGSILAETLEAEKIERLVAPVKDLFGAIFFVSVGMMVDPEMIAEYWLPIVVITLAILFGQIFLGSASVVLAGQPLKVAMQCGFSLTQIGEFAFIIASLGISLGVTSDFLYPVVVAVSVVTAFITPYSIRMAIPAYEWVDSKLPDRWKRLLERYSSGWQPVNVESHWRTLLWAIGRTVLVYSVLSIAVIVLFFKLGVPLLQMALPDFTARLVAAVLMILLISPFLRAIVMKKNHSVEFLTLWGDNRFNRAPLVFTLVLRFVIAVGFVLFIVENLFHASTAFLTGIALVCVGGMIMSRSLKRQSIQLERKFKANLNSRETQEEFTGKKRPKYAGNLLSHDLHLSDFDIPSDSLWAGKTLKELNFGSRYGVHVASIIRGMHRINIPGAEVRLYPGDTIQVIGTDEQLARFGEQAEKVADAAREEDIESREMFMKQWVVDESSELVGKTLQSSGIRERYRCLVVGMEKSSGELMMPRPGLVIEAGDVIWVVGEEKDVYRFIGKA